MKHLRQYIRQIIRENVEEKSEFEYINIERPDKIYLHGKEANAFLKALDKDEISHVPSMVIFLAPAWKREDGIPIANVSKLNQGKIYHGDLDVIVPLKHSVELAGLTGFGLYVVPNCDHNIGKDSQEQALRGVLADIQASEYSNILNDITGIKMARDINPRSKKISGDTSRLPEWGNSNYASAPLIMRQYTWCRKNLFAKGFKL